MTMRLPDKAEGFVSELQRLPGKKQNCRLLNSPLDPFSSKRSEPRLTGFTPDLELAVNNHSDFLLTYLQLVLRLVL